MTLMQLKFEDWAKEHHVPLDRVFDGYGVNSTRMMWESWQAAWKVREAVSEPPVRAFVLGAK